MNTATKGVLGGVGTFMDRNRGVVAEPGTMTAGYLELTTQGPGEWTDRQGHPVDISTYRMVSGDELFFTQKLDVTVEGDKVAAYLNTSLGSNASAFTGNFSVDRPFLEDAEGNLVDNTLTTSYEGLVATTRVTFGEAEKGREGVDAWFNPEKLMYTLMQVPYPGLG